MRFICDAMLGRLARYLRMLGFDVVYTPSVKHLPESCLNDADPPLLLTRRTADITYKPSLFIRSDTIEDQITEIRTFIAPYLSEETFMTRCIQCNSLLSEVPKENIEWSVPEYVYHHQIRFKRCPSCGKVYWEGTHISNIRRRLQALGLFEKHTTTGNNDEKKKGP